jgi:hypothetical protein
MCLSAGSCTISVKQTRPGAGTGYPPTPTKPSWRMGDVSVEEAVADVAEYEHGNPS